MDGWLKFALCSLTTADGLLAAVDRTSRQSLYRRFFSFKRGFTDQEIDFYVNVDFVSHVALAALLQEDGHAVIVGGARYIMVRQGSAEVAFVVDDAHQGQGHRRGSDAPPHGHRPCRTDSRS